MLQDEFKIFIILMINSPGQGEGLPGTVLGVVGCREPMRKQKVAEGKHSSDFRKFVPSQRPGSMFFCVTGWQEETFQYWS